MASPAEIRHGLPDTLPEDFAEWDGGASSAPHSVNSDGPATVPGPDVAPVTAAQLAGPHAAEEPLANVLRIVHSSAPAKFDEEEEAFFRRLRSINDVVDKLPGTASPKPAPVRVINEGAQQPRGSNGAAAGESHSTASPQAGALTEDDQFLFQSFHSKSLNVEEGIRPRKNWTMAAAISGGVVLVLLVLSLVFFRSRPSTVKQPVVRQAVATGTQAPAATNVSALQAASSAKPSPARQPAASNSDPAAHTAVDQVADAPQVQSQMMSDQLATPARISHAIDPRAAEEAPPTTRISAAGMEGVSSNSPIGSVFSGQGAKVRGVAPKVVTISEGVAVGLLVQRTQPIYPPIAKSARVEGRVLLKATISATGIIKDVQVVSGPPMLRQAAVDAGRTWRYKPYKLDNQPVDAETTVEVVFSLLG